MARRKKRMKLPNGFGHIKYLGEKRRNPYGAYPPVTEWTPTGPVTTKAIGYYPTWEEAYEMLTAWNMEQKGMIRVNKGVYIDRSPTFEEVYRAFYAEKYSGSKAYSKSSMNATAAAFKNCSVIHQMQIGALRYDDLQNVVNCCPLKHSSLELIVSLMHQVYAYALKHDYVDRDYSQFLYIPIADDNESGVPFSENDLRILKEHDSDPVCRMILVMCFSGFRIAAYTKMETNLQEWYFRGGVKTAAGKDRIVPIHSCIRDYVRSLYCGTPNLLGVTTVQYRNQIYAVLESVGLSYAPTGEKHTPHDCRHTFSMLCEKYGVSENDRKRMLGHSFGGDITNGVYGHREIEDLRKEVEKIKVPGFCS